MYLIYILVWFFVPLYARAHAWKQTNHQAQKCGHKRIIPGEEKFIGEKKIMKYLVFSRNRLFIRAKNIHFSIFPEKKMRPNTNCGNREKTVLSQRTGDRKGNYHENGKWGIGFFCCCRKTFEPILKGLKTV